MANTSNSNTDWTKSAGYSDVSGLIPDGPLTGITAGSSMQATNTISDSGHTGAPGTPSEGSAGVTATSAKVVASEGTSSNYTQRERG